MVGTTPERSINSRPGRSAPLYGRDVSSSSLVGKRVLLVDDEPTVREVVAAYLERDGFVVLEAENGRDALLTLDRQPDLVLLDVMIPEVDGFSVLRRVRAVSDVPVILLTARGDEPDRVLGLELGADDYVVKPFSPRELTARVKTVLRRSRGSSGFEGDRLEFGDLTIDPTTREVTVAGQRVAMRPLEFDLLYFLARSPRQVFTRSQLLEQVWESSSDWQDTSTVTVHVRRVRTKIEPDPNHPRWLETVWGVGYRFEP